MLVVFTDIVILCRKDPFALKVDEAVQAVHLHKGAAVVVKLLGVVEGGFYNPVLLLVPVSVLFGFLVLGGL